MKSFLGSERLPRGIIYFVCIWSGTREERLKTLFWQSLTPPGLVGARQISRLISLVLSCYFVVVTSVSTLLLLLQVLPRDESSVVVGPASQHKKELFIPILSPSISLDGCFRATAKKRTKRSGVGAGSKMSLKKSNSAGTLIIS